MSCHTSCPTARPRSPAQAKNPHPTPVPARLRHREPSERWFADPPGSVHTALDVLLPHSHSRTRWMSRSRTLPHHPPWMSTPALVDVPLPPPGGCPAPAASHQRTARPPPSPQAPTSARRTPHYPAGQLAKRLQVPGNALRTPRSRGTPPQARTPGEFCRGAATTRRLTPDSAPAEIPLPGCPRPSRSRPRQAAPLGRGASHPARLPGARRLPGVPRA